jgi:hypothetical protein
VFAKRFCNYRLGDIQYENIGYRKRFSVIEFFGIFANMLLHFFTELKRQICKEM